MSHNMSMPMDMPMPEMVMHMTFFWGKDVIMLFNNWPNGKLGMYILALAFIFVLAVIIELSSIFSVLKPGTGPFVGALAQALVHGLRMGLAYLVMLSVMSYNLGVFIVAVAGHAVGCFLAKYNAIARAASKP